MIKKIVFLLMSPITLFGQMISENDLKDLSVELHSKVIQYEDPSTGVKGRGVTSLGRKLIFQYDVPDDWFPFEDIKEQLISQLIDTKNDKLYVSQHVDIGYYYFKNEKLIKSVSIDWEDLKSKKINLGKYLDLTKHPKSNGLEIKLKSPLNWDIKEGDRPHIVKKFVNDDEVFLVFIKESGMFYSKSDVDELFSSDNSIKEIIDVFNQGTDFDLIDYKIMNVDNYPFLFYKGITTQERLGVSVKSKTFVWLSLLEDQFIYFMGMGLEDYYEDYFQIMNSVILFNQY